MSTSPTRNQKQSTSSSVHHKLSLLTSSSSSSSSSSKPFIKSKSQTTASIVFPSFRFSPESEELQEITGDEALLGAVGGATTAEEEETRRASFGGSDAERPSTPPQQPPQDPSSSKSGGDISPLKEYILKHKWANKWDKRSLSLDLDLKGKIITAIEDKRRSFVSHFYNEEDEATAEILREVDPLTPNLTSSCSIPELAKTSSLLEDQYDHEDSSVHSDSLLNRGNKRAFGRFNFDEENNSDYFDEFELSPESSSLPNTPMTNLLPDDLKNLIVEEIGVDCCEDTSMVGEDGKVNLSLLREFVLSPDSVQEMFQGLPTLYNPPSVVNGLRKFPLQEVVSTTIHPAGVEESDDEMLYRPVRSETNMTFASVIRGLIRDIAYHPGVRYWIGMLAIVLMLDLGPFLDRMIWFGLGISAVVIINRALESGQEEDESSQPSVMPSAVSSVRSIDNGQASEVYWKSQGWMLTLPPVENLTPYPNYDAFSFHLRNTKSVFIRLDGSNLLISHPHPKHRIPKRRLWSDPLITSDMIFIRHQHYNLYGAKVEIVPIGLARKRVWCKKYPISITLACRDRYLGKLLEVNGGDGSPGEKNERSDEPGSSVSFSKDERGNSSVRVGNKEQVLRGEVYKEESCTGKTVFLFARTDREKDDWFRRLVYASKFHSVHKTTSTTAAHARYSPDFSNFVSYMKRACPTLHIPSGIANNSGTKSPRSATPTNELYETVLIPNLNPPNHSNTNSPSTSRKSTPEKERSISPPRELFTPTFLNALVARIFYDFLRSPKWTHEVKQLIDRKLFFLRKPKVVESLKVKELDLGDSLPIINHASSPVLDKQGLWIDLDLSFTGSVVITIEAFVNLFNMGKSSEADMKPEVSKKSPSKSPSSRLHAMFDSDADDSGESSESEEELELDEDAEKLKAEGGAADNRGKMLKYADAIAKSSVMRNKHVQKVVGNIAATPFVLTVEIKKVMGSVAVNIPPVPNDRVWIGFRTNPVIDINVRPKVGERVVNLSQITGWIKKKLLLEFQRVMVCPNMMDVTIALMEFELPK